jgi:hypothetical protein
MGSTRTPLEGPAVDPLHKLQERLAKEFGSVPTERIEFVARQALDGFDSARIRDYVPVFAWRRASQVLRANG